MAYITNTDIQTRLGSAVYVQLTDDAGTGSANIAVVDESRAGAEGEVDAYLARRFAVPIDLAANPELGGILKSIALDLTEYRLRLRRPPVSAEATARRDSAASFRPPSSPSSLAPPPESFSSPPPPSSEKFPPDSPGHIFRLSPSLTFPSCSAGRSSSLFSAPSTRC